MCRLLRVCDGWEAVVGNLESFFTLSNHLSLRRVPEPSHPFFCSPACNWARCSCFRRPQGHRRLLLLQRPMLVPQAMNVSIGIASLVAQTVKNPPAVQEIWVQSLCWKDPLEKAVAAHSSIHAWRIPWTEEPSKLQSMGLQRVRYN